MERAPPEFRAEHERLQQVIEPVSGKTIAAILGDLRGDPFKVNPSGGHTLHFYGGSICSFDHTGRFPLVCLYGPIFSLHSKLGASESAYGRPITTVVDLPDGSKCCIFEGGHIHAMGGLAEPFPAEQCIAPYKPVPPTNPFGLRPGGLPPSFHQRWVELSTVRHHSGQMFAEILGYPRHLEENPCGGQRFLFLHGQLVSINKESLPYVMYGEIWELWKSLGWVDSGWGRPLTDEQPLEDGGRCQVMEGGHIHSYAGIAKGYPADQCTARYKPTTRALIFNQMPPHFQRKWSMLALQNQPLANRSVAELLGTPWHRLKENGKKPGQHFHFLGGYLISLDSNPEPPPMQVAQHSFPPPSDPSLPGYLPPGARSPYGSPPVQSGPPMYQLPQQSPSFPSGSKGPNTIPIELIPPFAVYGTISEFYVKEGGVDGKYGRPLADEQDLGDGGRCSIFEGGHIHMYRGVAQGATPETCTAPYQPRSPPPPSSTNSPIANYPTQAPGMHHQPNWGSTSPQHHQPNWGSTSPQHHQPNYPSTPSPQVYGQGQPGTQQQQGADEVHKRTCGWWYCLTGIDMDQAPEDFGPWCVYASTGLKPGQHSGYCCHGCCRVTF